MPAAAVIPALIAYTKVVAVKKLVVEVQNWETLVGRMLCTSSPVLPMGYSPLLLTGRR